MFWSRRRKRFKKSTSESPRKVLIKQILVGILLAVILVGLGYGIWYGTRIEALTIKEVTVSGGETVSNDRMRALAEAELDGTYFKLIPKRFAWTYPHERIVSVLRGVTRVKDVKVERETNNKIKVRFFEYEPSALWCSAPDDPNCVFIDRSGFAFDEAPILKGGALLRYGGIGEEPKTGIEAYSEKYMEDTYRFADTVAKQLGFDVVYIEQMNPDDIAYHLNGGGIIKTSAYISVLETLENLETILASEEFKHLQPGNFQYIDLRYGNKVFVNEEEIISENEDTATTTDSEAFQE